MFFPKAHEEFVGWIPKADRGDVLRAYEKALFAQDRAVVMPAARHWVRYAETCGLLHPDPETVEQIVANDTTTFSTARLHAHFFLHYMFLAHNQLLNHIDRTAHLPTTIVKGMQDVLCPPSAAYDLKQYWPHAELIMVPRAAHSPNEPAMCKHCFPHSTNSNAS